LWGVFCHNCGHRNPDGVNFCSSCGSALPAEPSDTTVVLQAVDVHGELGDEEHSVTLVEVPRGSGVLVVKRGPNVGARYLLDRPVTRAGRHPESDIFLDDITVSRRHAELERQADDLEAQATVAYQRHADTLGVGAVGVIKEDKKPDVGPAAPEVKGRAGDEFHRAQRVGEDKP